MGSSSLQLAIEQLVAARQYTLWLLDSIPQQDWGRMPPGASTHVAWQVGHLAMAEYALCLRRLRGQRHEDDQLIGPDILAAFGRDSAPNPDPAAYPSPEAIRSALDAVHREVLIELPGFPPDELDAPLDPPHRIAQTKLEAVWWCSRHEMLHAGQIGLLRRLLGYPPLW